MESVSDKLKLLNYDADFCDARKMKPIHRCRSHCSHRYDQVATRCVLSVVHTHALVLVHVDGGVDAWFLLSLACTG